MIDVKHLSKSFGDHLVLDDITEHIDAGEKIVIIGPSGSGKSTFLRCLNLLETPTGGAITFDNAVITDPKTNINAIRRQMGMAAGIRVGHLTGATGSGGTTAGLLLGAKLFLPGVKVTGIGVDTDPFEEIVPQLAAGAAELLSAEFSREKDDFEMVYHYGAGYAIPNPEDTPVIENLARSEGILLDPVYTGKAFAGMISAQVISRLTVRGPRALILPCFSAFSTAVGNSLRSK